MKRLVFVRHRKAEDFSVETGDYERSLTKKGKMVSRTMAMRLRDKNLSIGRYISSPAFRALETALIFVDELGADPSELWLDNNLYYDPGVSRFLSLIWKVDDEIDSVVLFGHNPAFTDLCDMLAKNGSELIPKSGVVSIIFPVKKWEGVKFGEGQIEFFMKPDDAA